MNDKKKTFFWAGIIAFAALCVFSVVYAVSNNVYVYEGGTYVDNPSPNVNQPVVGSEDVSFGALSDEVRPARLLTLKNIQIDEQLAVTGTSTIDLITLGSSVSKALTFTAGATTTPGGLFSLQNTGANKICRGLPEVNLTSQVEGSMNFSVGTSSSATAWSASGGSLIASTTVATGSTILLGNENVGSYFGFNTGSTTQSWIWQAGHYILGAFDKGGAGAGTRNNATTTDYSTAAGKVYVDCHTL